jgi:hypothetical protein
MSKRAKIAVLLLLLAFAFVVFSLFSTYLHRGHLLAQDLIGVGFRPGEPFRPNSSEVTRRDSDNQFGSEDDPFMRPIAWMPKSDTNSTFYRNARVITNSDGGIVGMSVERNADEPYFSRHYKSLNFYQPYAYKPDDSNLSVLSVRTSNGRDIFSLTRLEAQALYGDPNSIDVYRMDSPRYRYRINSKEGVEIRIRYDGYYPDSMVTEILAMYYYDPHLWYGEYTDYFTWPKSR